MAEYCKRIFKKEFTGKKGKDCYLKACGYIAKNILSKNKISKNCMYKFSKKYNNETGLTTVLLEVYSTVNESEVKNKHCDICKETHSSFFISEETNCNWCKIAAFDRRLENSLNVISQTIKEEMKREND